MLTLQRAKHLLLIDMIGRRRSSEEADYVLRRNDGSLVALEIGFGEKTPAQAAKTVEKLGCAYGITVGEHRLSLHSNVVMVPKEMFLSV
jgi:hypothetical protein